MNYISLLQKNKGFEQLFGVVLNLIFWEALHVILLHVLVQVSIEELKDKAIVFSEHQVVKQAHNMAIIVGIFFHQVLKKLGLICSKLVIQFCVSVDFDCDL